MTEKMILKNAKMVCRDEIVSGSISLHNGVIESIDAGYSGVNGARDLEGDYLLPGFVEMHTDNLEKHLSPRPGVIWPSALAALKAHDNQIVGAGITTVLDAVFVGEEHEASVRRALLQLSVEAIHRAAEAQILRAEHLLHLRCEISEAEMMNLFMSYSDSPYLRLVSLMDHTPGQRQFTDPAKYRQYYEKQGWSNDEYEEVAARLRNSRALYAQRNWAVVVEFCRQLGIVMASHDDTTCEHVEEAAEAGMAISEFPTRKEAAARARDLGLKVVVGAPNLVRGESHSGNVSARELAEEGILDALSSDYVPTSLILAVFTLHEKMDYPLPRAASLASANPAGMLGLHDRGEIAPGKRADLIWVRLVDGLPIIQAVWQKGRQVF